LDLIRPDWPAPARVRAWSTTRAGGASAGPFASLNLGDHVGDDPDCVARNRARVRDRLSLPAEPLWLHQVHGCEVADAGVAPSGCTADAAVARAPGQVCAVLTADCLPLLLCDRAGQTVAAVHAGWRGLAAGVVERAVGALGADPEEVLAWLGPAIGPEAFEVGAEVRDLFLTADTGALEAFRPGAEGRWLADLGVLAGRRLERVGVRAVFGGGLCTYSDPSRFFSYRRDGVTGRMASLIWLAPDLL
jgi:YfiH family protein